MTTYLWHEPIATLEATIAAAHGPTAFHFDDGYASHLEAAGLLEAAGRLGVFYLVTRWIGLPGFLSWDDVRRLAAAGHAIGNHTASHVWLGKVPWEARLLEIREAQEALAAVLGAEPTRFAYPYGRVDADARAAVARFHFTEARGIHELEARL